MADAMTRSADAKSNRSPPVAGAEAVRGSNAPQPIRTLRDWIDHLAARDRLAVANPGVALQFELSAVAKRLDGERATLFPRPDNHPVPVISGLISSRLSWSNWASSRSDGSSRR